MLVIPAIDILDGQVVRVRQGAENTAKSYSDDPTNVAESFRRNGASLIHVVDLDAALHKNRERNAGKIEVLLSRFKNSLEIAGGIRSKDVAILLFSKGARRIVLSSLAYNDPESAVWILKQYDKDRVVLALDYDEKGIVRIGGWKRESGEQVGSALTRFSKLGFSNFLLTSVKSDGMLEGPDYQTLSELKKAFPKQHLIASGGISSLEDLKRLESLGIEEAIVGKALYEGRIDPTSVFEKFNKKRVENTWH